MKRLFAELRRRNVWRAAIFYVGAVWALAQGISQLGPAIGLPEWSTRWFIVAAVIGFPVWIAFAWFYELTPEGLKRERDVATDETAMRRTGHTFDLAIIGVLALAVVLLLTDRFVAHRGGHLEATVAVSNRSIAVLPFVDMSQDKDQEYFSDGIAEDLLNLLTRMQQLQVAARTSSFLFKGKELPIPDIAKALHVANILEGSVRKAGNEVRITAQLVRASDGIQIWSQSWDRQLDDVFKIQDEIAAAVVDQLRVSLLGETPTARIVDPKAYPLILQAEALSEQQSKESRARSIETLKQALAIAPDEARAWADLARDYVSQSVYSDRSGDEATTLARDAANRALGIDPDNVIALSMLASIASGQDFDLPRAATYLQRALILEPGNLLVLNAAANLLHQIGRFDQALPIYAYRAAHDPANPEAYAHLSAALVAARQWDAAIDASRTVQRLSPGHSLIHGGMGVVLLIGKKDPQGALKEFAAEEIDMVRDAGTALALHDLGRKAESDAAMQALIAKAPDQPATIAANFAYLGDVDNAFAWLDKAATHRDPGLSVVMDPFFDGLHGDARWLPLLRRIGYAPEQLAKIKLSVVLPQTKRVVADR